MVKISEIADNNIDIVAKLATDCFIDNEYFVSYKHKGNRGYNKLFAIMKKSIEICKKCGVAQQASYHDQAVGFLLAFDYLEVRKTLPDEFAFFFSDNTDLVQDGLLKATEMSLNEIVNTNTMYLMTIGVSQEFRNTGIGSSLLANFILEYNDYQIIADVTDKTMQKICKKFDFKEKSVQNNRYSIFVRPSNESEIHVNDKKIRIALPANSKFLDDRKYANIIELKNVEPLENSLIFSLAYGNLTKAEVYEITPHEYLLLQSRLDFTSVKENAIIVGNNDRVLYYTSSADLIEENEGNLNSLIKLREKNVDNLIVDICTSIPMTYASLDRIYSAARINSHLYIKEVLAALNFRSEYESGIPVAHYADRGYKDRINRVYLGNIRVQLKSEIEFSFGNNIRQSDIGEEFNAFLIASIDKKSNICVLHIIKFAFGEELTQYLDGVSRNQIIIRVEDKTVNLYDYLYDMYGIEKAGTARTMITSFEQKSDIDKGLLSSVLFGETYYQYGEGLGCIVDDEIIGMINSDHGVSQYNYADVFMHKTVVFQTSKELIDLLKYRIVRESVTIFYIELVLFEEAAITFADSQIRKFLANMNQKTPNNVLKSYGNQLEDYASTIDFWNVQMNYPSSQTSMENLRSNFKIAESREQYQRDSEIFQKIYETKNNYSEKVEASILTAVGAILTVISIVELLWNTAGYNKLAVAGLVVAVLLFLKNRFILRRRYKNKKK